MMQSKEIDRVSITKAKRLQQALEGPIFPSGSYGPVYHACALRSNGIYCQGHNRDGELGDGTFSRTHAGPLVGTAGAYHLAAGGFHTCAVLNTNKTGTVACWRNNGDGQVTGNPTSYNYGSPFVLPPPYQP